MAISLTVTLFTNIPGAVRITIIGDPVTPITITRFDNFSPNGVPVRNTVDATTSGSGLYQIIDAEPAFGTVRYEATDGTDTATASINVSGPPSGRAVLRSVLAPYSDWGEVVIVDETSMAYESSSTVFGIIGSHNPVVVADVRRERSGMLTFGCDDMNEAQGLIDMMRDGTPLLLRSCTDPKRVHDGLFYPLEVREERYGSGTRRLVFVDYQSVDLVRGVAVLPPATTWTYNDLAIQSTAPTYASVVDERDTYIDLVLDPIR